MKRFLICSLMTGGLMAAGALPVLAQRDFLTSDEIEKIREAQDPNARLQMYLQFARQRLDQLQQQIARDKKGRSLVVRQLLEDYSQIIDAIDTVSDDALKRKVDIAAGAAAVAAAEQKFLEQLKKIEDTQTNDLDMYEVSLKDAIGTTSDSMDTAKQDLGKRSEVVAARTEKEKKEVEDLTPKDRLKQQKAEDAKADDGKPKRKPPTLYRPGEKPDQPNQPKK
jgi:predicted transcriptional regulator